MLKEVLVVEGKMDTVAVKKAVDAETIETGGFTLAPYTAGRIEAAYRKRGIIIMTGSRRRGGEDPQVFDGALSPGRTGFCAQGGGPGPP